MFENVRDSVGILYVGRYSVQMNMLKRNINFECDIKFFFVWFSWKSHLDILFFSVWLFVLNWNWLCAIGIDIVPFFFVCLNVGMSAASFGVDLVKIFWRNKKKNDAWWHWCLVARVFDFLCSLMQSEFSFPISTSIWVKVHQDLMKSACTAYEILFA